MSMMSRNLLNRFNLKFRFYWKKTIFKYAIIIHPLYFVISIILALTFFQTQNDFLVYYKAGEIALKDFQNIYNPTFYNWPFRYLPLAAIYFIPFYLMGFESGFIIFNLINLILNFLIIFYLYKIIVLINPKSNEENENRFIFYISIFLLSLPQLFNYILGQINLYIAFFLVLSLYLYLKYDRIKIQFIASLILGISLIFKPITILMTPFIILSHYDFDTKKFKFEFSQSLIRIVGVLIPLLVNVGILMLNTKLLAGFISINITGESNTLVNYSFSITKLITNFLFFIGIPESIIIQNQLLIFATTLLIILLIGFLVFIFRRNYVNSIIYGYILAIVIMLLTYFDSWDHHLLNLLPLIIIMFFTSPQNSKLNKKYLKPCLYFLSFLDIACMGLYVLMNPDVDNLIFPFNFIPTLFLLYLFYGIIHYSIKKHNRE